MVLFVCLVIYLFFVSSDGLSYTSPKEAQHFSTITQIYGRGNLAEKPTFQGGYINFGYWKNIDLQKKILTKEDRISASRDLYRLVFSKMKLNSHDDILEVGCGLGKGVFDLWETHKPRSIVGIDLTPEHIKKAQKILAKIHTDSIRFYANPAHQTDFKDASFSKIFSVEAIQYFPSVHNFAKESYRLLKPGGRIVITAHFSTSEKSRSDLVRLLPTVKNGIDLLPSIRSVRAIFKKIGFQEISCHSIGKNVFKGNDRWISQVPDVYWANNIYKSYEIGAMDYYLIVLDKID